MGTTSNPHGILPEFPAGMIPAHCSGWPRPLVSFSSGTSPIQAGLSLCGSIGQGCEQVIHEGDAHLTMA
jgi:hypothetical protein